MKWLAQIDRWFGTLFCLALLAAIATIAYWLRSRPEPHYSDSFASGGTAEWHAYGGSWDSFEGAIRNNSDERGAKLITGSSEWSDYEIEAELLLLGPNGDAGVIVRSSDEEEGVDAYSGYYVGLRDRNNTMVIGRADHGWLEYQAVSVKDSIHAFHWYHLKVIAVGCVVAASAFDPETRQETIVAMRENDCARTGRIGLRSYSSGGLWKNVRAHPASPADISALVARAQVTDSPERMQTETGFNSLLPYSGKGVGPTDSSSNSPAMDIHTPPLSSLRFVSDIHPFPVTVRGSVILTAPVLYIEDSSGGVAVESHGSAVKIGDELQVTGVVDARPGGVMLRNTILRLLWSRGPAPPLSVTASQAVTGAFDGMLVEIEGRLMAKRRVQGQSVVLDLQSGHQAFRAILEGARQDLMFDRLRPNSLLRLRGVCVADPAFTENLTSFALLLRSSEDIGIAAGPPWWDTRHLVEGAFALMILVVVAVFVYFRAEHWKMSAVVEERSRMAREIHDTLAQSFAGIALQLESALHGPRPDIESAPVTMALSMARQSRREAHRSIAALRTLHTDQTLENMLYKVLRPQVAESHVELSVTSKGTPERLSGEAESQVLRIAQEAVANATQHALATRIAVHLVFDNRMLILEIEDDGRGFEVSTAPGSEEGHFGITGMRERAASMKADLTIQSSRDGTRVLLDVPIPSRRMQLWKLAPPWTRRLGQPLRSWRSH
ncbi:MAG TPA: histidine kinase [Terriglobales bacterium]|nr:histidine kinase [Terriglobales bacterium]